jgi:hypothetical protein
MVGEESRSKEGRLNSEEQTKVHLSAMQVGRV